VLKTGNIKCGYSAATSCKLKYAKRYNFFGCKSLGLTSVLNYFVSFDAGMSFAY